jgi:hypothetical protein
LRKRLYQTIQRLTDELLPKVIAAQPRPRTGELRRLTQAYVDDNKIKNFVRGRVRVLRTVDKNTAAAAGALEYGSTGKFYEVHGYMRRGPRGRFKTRVITHLRRGTLQERRFLRGPAAIMIPKARAEIARVLNEVIAES